MKKMLVSILLLLTLPACLRQGEKKKTSHTKYEQRTGKTSTYDEEIEGFVLEDNDHDLFDEAEVQAGAKKDTLDDSWAWEELDEEQPTETIYFDFDRVNIRKDQMPLVRHNAELAKLACEDGATIIIEGHSCLITRSQSYNQSISQKRAEAVKAAFKKHGVSEKCMKAVGRGTSCLVTRDEDRNAQAANRRVNIIFQYPQ